MITWLIQSTSAHPDLAAGVAPEGLLAEREQARLAGLKVAKRRREWLLGRWTAKHLIQNYVEQQTGVRLPLDAIVVENGPDGAPYPILDCGLWIGDAHDHPQSKIHNLKSKIANLQSLSLSISHSHDFAFCAISDAAGGHVGADIELIEHRSPQFADEYFTDTEQAQVRVAREPDQDTIITAIWSAKEAALKALRLGLTVNTRWVSCNLRQGSGVRGQGSEVRGQRSGVEGLGAGIEEWNAFDVMCAPQLPQANGASIRGHWRRFGDYVLTLAVKEREEGTGNREQGTEETKNNVLIFNSSFLLFVLSSQFSVLLFFCSFALLLFCSFVLLFFCSQFSVLGSWFFCSQFLVLGR
jgi:4'-phosphopantetheinyl transferase